jgi:tRNA-5-methyluridine54 2-sulfurtransferase
MKCRSCGGQATIRLPQYNTALCSKDFIAFFTKRVHHTINKYGLITPGDRILVAVSGGKDSLALWQLLNDLGYDADGIHIHLGIDTYSDISFAKTKAMAEKLKRRLYYFSLPEVFCIGIKELSRTARRPACSICGMIKRYVMNRASTEYGYSVLATGHNLDDEASALLGNLLHWKEEYLWKKGVALDAEGTYLTKKVKPFFLCTEKEAAAFAVMNGIDYVYDECPYSVGAKTLLYKDLLNSVEDRSPATKLAFMKGYLKRSKQIKEERIPFYSEHRQTCTICGYPSFTDLCNFCQLVSKHGTSDPVVFHLYDPATGPSGGPPNES